MNRTLLLCASLFLACAPRPAASPAAMGVLTLSGVPKLARVIVDDQYVGSLEMVASHGIGLPEGKHRLTVEAPGFFPRDELVTITRGQRSSVRIALSERPD